MIDRLHEIRLPTLVTCGRFDEAGPERMARLESIAGAELVVFEANSHTVIDETAAYLARLRTFLERIDS